MYINESHPAAFSSCHSLPLQVSSSREQAQCVDSALHTDSAALNAPRLLIRVVCEQDRVIAEKFIADHYWREHKARIQVRHPHILVLESNEKSASSVVAKDDAHDAEMLQAGGQQTDQWQAAAGLKRGDEGALMVEAYLQRSVESALEQYGLSPGIVPRHTIMEIGALVGVKMGSGRQLMLSLVNALDHLHCDWLVVTASREVRNGLSRLGVTMHSMIPADPGNLAAYSAAISMKEEWGSYYEHAPQVVAIRPRHEAARMRRDPLLCRLLASAPAPREGWTALEHQFPPRQSGVTSTSYTYVSSLADLVARRGSEGAA